MTKHELSVGETREARLVDDLSRTQIVQYAGASGDFNPVHTDERYATEIAGFPSVFAHGMLTMGMTGRVITDWVGADHLVRFGARFVKQVWPGDTLIAVATVDDIREEDGRRLADISIVTRNGAGEVVLSGNATAFLEP